MKSYSVSKETWSEVLSQISQRYEIFAPIKNNYLDYEQITPENASQISYNQARPTTPLKAFFFPVKENVVRELPQKKRVILGATSCDLEALKIMDRIFLDEDYPDPYYKQHRENTLLIGTDCHSVLDSCHCTAYGVKPYPESNYDIRLNRLDSKVILEPLTEAGSEFLEAVKNQNFFTGDIHLDQAKIKEINETVMAQLQKNNEGLPDSEATRKKILASQEETWKTHAAKCVSCGACSAICPTCHCFLLIDKENFEKLKNWDTCQYPAFEKVAAGEDPLNKLYERLKNRYMCKFIYKPDMFGEIACTGCGRCIDACIAGIDKNEVIMDI